MFKDSRFWREYDVIKENLFYVFGIEKELLEGYGYL